VKKEEVDDSMRRYKAGVTHWEGVRDAIEKSMRAAEGIPLMQGSLNRLRKALGQLEELGAVLAFVPELAQSVMEEKDISAKVRAQAQQHGLILRYD